VPVRRSPTLSIDTHCIQHLSFARSSRLGRRYDLVYGSQGLHTEQILLDDSDCKQHMCIREPIGPACSRIKWKSLCSYQCCLGVASGAGMVARSCCATGMSRLRNFVILESPVLRWANATAIEKHKSLSASKETPKQKSVMVNSSGIPSSADDARAGRNSLVFGSLVAWIRKPRVFCGHEKEAFLAAKASIHTWEGLSCITVVGRTASCSVSSQCFTLCVVTA
jgi:hypothetical protein